MFAPTCLQISALGGQHNLQSGRRRQKACPVRLEPVVMACWVQCWAVPCGATPPVHSLYYTRGGGRRRGHGPPAWGRLACSGVRGRRRCLGFVGNVDAAWAAGYLPGDGDCPICCALLGKGQADLAPSFSLSLSLVTIIPSSKDPLRPPEQGRIPLAGFLFRRP